MYLKNALSLLFVVTCFVLPFHASALQQIKSATPLQSEPIVVTEVERFDNKNMTAADLGNAGAAFEMHDGYATFTDDSGEFPCAFCRTFLTEGEGILLLFRHIRGQVWFSFNQEWTAWGTDVYRRIDFLAGEGHWNISSYYGAKNTSYQSGNLQNDTWYYVIMRLGNDGQFYIQLWERDNPSRFLVNDEFQAAGEDWVDRVYRDFFISIQNAQIDVALFKRFTFQPDYELPDTPPTEPLLNLSGSGNIPMFAAPQPDAPIITILTNQQLPLLGIIADDVWYLVELEEQIGWIQHIDDLTAVDSPFIDIPTIDPDVGTTNGNDG
jgi:hypothetical protein